MSNMGGPSTEQLLQMAITNAKEGNKEGAELMLRQVLQADKRNDRAWMWMAYIETDPQERRRMLENAVRLNPDNKSAQKALEKINKKKASRDSRTMIYGGLALLALLILAALVCVIGASLS